MVNAQPPLDVQAIRAQLENILDSTDAENRVVGNAKFGVYAFYDYDGEPIYVGQTTERLRTRIRRHLTNQRTDAVAMNVLDPFEVCDIEMWPFFDLEGKLGNDADAIKKLNSAEHTVFRKVLSESTFGAVLNEADIPSAEKIDLPQSLRGRIVPDDLYEIRRHPDVRIARRANTIANLAKVISERSVSKGLRRTLVTQARRLERLSRERLAESGEDYPVERPGEETGSEPKPPAGEQD